MTKIDLRRGDFEGMHPKAKLFGFDEDKKLYTGDGVESINHQWATWCACIGMLHLEVKEAQAVPKWISVKDKLPSDDIGRVLAWVVEQNSLGKCGFVWNCSHSNGVFSDKFETFQVTHWMPLPDAPQEPAND